MSIETNNTSKKIIGFIGLGIMGKPMSKNLISSGYELIVFDVNSEPVDEVVSFGAKRASSVANVAQNADIIITMLPNSPHVESVLLAKDGVINNGKKDILIIDMSSIAPLVSQKCEVAAKEAGMHMIDAPVSGGEPKAVDGTLSIMCGGKKSDFDEAYPLLLCMGSSAVLTGNIGAGNTTKLCNQIIVGINIAAMGEAMTLAVKAGVDPKLVFNAIRGGLAGSTVLNAKMPMVLDRNFKPGFKMDLHIKDLKNAVETANDVNSPTMLSEIVLNMMKELSGKGEGQNDHCGLVRYYEDL